MVQKMLQIYIILTLAETVFRKTQYQGLISLPKPP